MNDIILNNGWREILSSEMEKDYFKNLFEFLLDEYEKEVVYPRKKDIFNAFNYTDFEDVKVVIFGQDPYHGFGQAKGLSFSVQKGIKIPPSLNNIYKELKDDLGCEIPNHGDLTKWTEEGVLLLNTILTVREGEPGSHKNKGWEIFTNKVIEELNDRDKPIVFILWGNKSIEKESIITNPNHFIIKSSHPSPLGAYRSFWGSKPFSKTNDFLESIGENPIDWKII